jgi:hypothetical protein
MESQTIFKLRVLKSLVRKFPFDIVYFFSEAQKPLLPRIFPWSLCVIVTDDLWERLKKIQVQCHELRPHTGPRELTVPERTIEALVPRSAAVFMLVPILPLTRQSLHRPAVKGQEKHRLVPYLLAPQYADLRYLNFDDKISAPKPSFEGILDDRTVLFSPRGPIRPVCLCCPRHLFHLQNLCRLGGKHCYDELVLWQPEIPPEAAREQLQEDSTHDAGTSTSSP